MQKWKAYKFVHIAFSEIDHYLLYILHDMFTQNAKKTCTKFGTKTEKIIFIKTFDVAVRQHWNNKLKKKGNTATKHIEKQVKRPWRCEKHVISVKEHSIASWNPELYEND